MIVCLSMLWDVLDKISPEENEAFEDDFSEEEIKRAVFDSYAEGAPGPDGLSFLFYQKFWPIIKMDLMALVRSFERGDLEIS
jgi:hypothetical protein